MKKGILIHGWDGNPNNAWFPWLKKELEKKEFSVIIPNMPNPEEPKIDLWVNKIKEYEKDINDETYLIGHRVGCQAILRFLEKLPGEKKDKAVILVAPWITLDEQTLKDEGEDVWEIAKPWIKTPIDFDKTKIQSGDFTLIYSTTDPYSNSEDLAVLQEKLDAPAVSTGDKSHLDDEAGVKELPEMLSVIDEIESEVI